MAPLHSMPVICQTEEMKHTCDVDVVSDCEMKVIGRAGGVSGILTVNI